MLDILLIPAVVLVILALRSAHRGAHRLHGHLMIAAFTLIAVRLLLYPRNLTEFHLSIWLATLGGAGVTMLLGRVALAWREARSTHSSVPRVHRGFGAVALIGLALTTLVWLLRSRS